MERGDIRVLFIAVFVTQVFGNPAYYWNPQPDCSHVNGYQQQSEDQQNNYQPNNYQDSGYQQQQQYQQNAYQAVNQQTNNARNDYQDQTGYVYEKPTEYQNSMTVPYPQFPSYQETLQSMIEETIRSLKEIMQVTVSASKQELSLLARMFFDSIPKKFCKSENEDEDVPYEYNNEAEQNEGGHNNPQTVSSIRPLKGNLVEQGGSDHLSTTSNPFSSTKPSSSTPPLYNTLSIVNSTNTSNETLSPSLHLSEGQTTLSSVSTSSATSANLQGSSQSTPIKDGTLTTPGSISQLLKIDDKSGIENSSSSNISAEMPSITTHQSGFDKSKENSTMVPELPSPLKKPTTFNNESTVVHDSFKADHISIQNVDLLNNATYNSSSSKNETSSLNSTPPVTTESDTRSEQSSSLSENETFQSTLPLNTHITTTIIPTALSDEAQNNSNTQNTSTANPPLENVQLNTTYISVLKNTTSNMFEDSTEGISNSAANPTNLNEYEQDQDNNDVDSDAINFPRNPKL